MSRPHSLARRLTVPLVVASAVLWIASVMIGGLVMRDELDESFDEALKESALLILPLAAHEFREGAFDLGEIVGLANESYDLAYVVTDPRGRVVAYSDRTPSEIRRMRVLRGYSWVGDHRIYAISDPVSRFGVAVIELGGERSHVLLESIQTLLMPLAVLIPLLVLIVHWVTRSALKPVQQFSSAIAARHGRYLEPLDLGDQPKELAPIADELEHLLRRLSAALEAERAFAAESAHELRTPIAGALAQAQGLRDALAGGPHEAALEDVERALRDLSDLSEQMLQLSRLEAGFAASNTVNDLSPIIELVLSETEFTRAENDRFDVQVSEEGALAAQITPDAFAIALRNILQNALNYSKAGTIVSVLVDRQSVRVINAGPVIPADVLPTLTRRFVRGDHEAEGTGLGLAISAAIMRDAGGKMELFSPARQKTDGFEAVLSFEKKDQL